MAENREKLLDKISNMLIYKKDYDIIKKILSFDDVYLISAIIEEVTDGNLYWSDFETVFPPEYIDTCKDSIEKQYELRETIRRLVSFRKWIRLNDNDYPTISGANLKLQKYLSSAGIIKYSNDDGSINKYWLDEYKNVRDDMLYSILTHKENDSPLVAGYKKKLFNAVENGKYVFETTSGIITLPEDTPDYHYEYKNGKVYKLNSKNNEVIETFLVINPNDILFSANEYIIPIDYRFQTLTAADKVFKTQNNLSDDEIRKMKSLYMYLKYNNYISDAGFKEGS